MTIGGVSFVLILGIINLLLIFFQIGSGKRYLKVNFILHRRLGLLLLVTAIIHAVLAYLSR